MDQQFSLSWNNFHGNLSKGFAGLLGNGEFVDVTIAVEGHLLQAHKVILSICSPYFKKMFQLNPCQHPIVVLKDVSHKAMKDLLQFMYHGEVSVKREDLTSFIGTAEVLQIKGLTNKETDEENYVNKQQDLSKQSVGNQNGVHEVDSNVSDTVETSSSMPEEVSHNTDLDLIQQRDFIEKLQRLSNLKRKSEEYLQKSYYSDLLSSEKRSKLKEKPFCKQKNLTPIQTYENFKNLYDDKALDISTFKNHLHGVCNMDKDIDDKANDQSPPESNVDLKTECDDLDIIVSDPAVCTTPKSFDGSRESKSISLGYQSPQDNATGINSLFLDLKNLVNGKVSTNTMRKPVNEDVTRHTVNHCLVTIPQKEDGKKKYPQRSCRLCWKIGKRRDTRFMCNVCEMPFCKSPCFDVHFNDVVKLSQLHGDYYAA